MSRRPWPIPPPGGLLIHHVSDTHIGYRPWSYGECDHVAADLADNLVPIPDILVHTGDITDNGAAAEDAYAIRWLHHAARGAPCLVAMGNHDIRDRRVHTRVTWERAYRRSANTYLDIRGIRVVTFAPDDFTGDDQPWTIPDATWGWLDRTVTAAPGPVILVDHYPPAELVVRTEDHVHPPSVFSTFIGDHPAIVGMLCGHLHKELADPTAAAFWTIGGRRLPVLCDLSMTLTLDGHSRDQSARIQSHTAYVTVLDDRWEIRYRAHGTRAWTGPSGQRVTRLHLATGQVTRSME